MRDMDIIIDLIYESAENTILYPVIIDALDALRAKLPELSKILEHDEDAKVTRSAEGEVFPGDIPPNQFAGNILERLLPHFRRAQFISAKMLTLERTCRFIQDLANRMPIGMIGVSTEGEILLSNKIADALLAGNSPLKLAKGKIRGALPEGDKLLHQALKEVTSESGAKSKVLRLKYPDQKKKLLILIMPVADEGGGAQICHLLIADQSVAMVSSPEMIRDLYQLSVAESKCVHLLINGLTTDEISSSLNITKHTVRAHLKSVFSKTETHSQGELISLVMRWPIA